jgi:DNA-binding MarR family transcriptional regulator
MNDMDDKRVEAYRSFLLMNEIAKEEPLSQRDLSKRLGIALGLVNSYLKNLVAKGFVRIKSFPKNRYGYLLTPQGIREKARLAYLHLSYFTSLYMETRNEYLDLFRSLRASGISEVVFCGVDEVAEIAYLSLVETGMTLRAVIDDEPAEKEFFGMTVQPLDTVLSERPLIVVTSLKKKKVLSEELERIGVNKDKFLCPGQNSGSSETTEAS